MKSMISSGIALAAFLMAAGCQKTAPADAEAETKDTPPVVVTVAKARVQTVRETVEAQGTLGAAQGKQAKLTAPIAGRLLVVAVREGDRVTAGQVVATVDTRTQTAQARSAAAAYQAAVSGAKQSELSAAAAAGDQSAAVRVARLYGW